MKIVSMTLELNLQIEDSEIYSNTLDCIAETGLQAVTDVMPLRNITGVGYTYSYAEKKSRRGLTITSDKKAR